ncbi:MAG TPA: LacI family DNA-binding transcriptional regulator [Bryobacteraceae bacterium]|nr:LacI family DNA-binding transcriptional regulator [Bryobacteraceae bacterium]
MATIKDVAEKAGVSPATVSYVLNEARKVRPETEQRVLWAARELGYQPNTAARSLAVGHSSIIGLIVPDILNPFFPEIAKSFQSEAAVYGMETVTMDGNNDPQRTRNLVERLLGLQAPAIAFLTSQVDAPVKELIAKKGIFAAYLGFGSPGPKISNISIEQRQGIEEAVHHLEALGHRRVGFIGGPSDGVFSLRRKAIFLECAAAAGMETRVFDSDFTVQGGYFGCSRVLGGFDATAIMTANDLMAIGALHYAYDRQIPVPAALSVVGFDNINFAQFTQPALTTVAAPRAEIGRLAFQSLWSLMHDSPGGDYEVPTGLVIRQTTGPAPTS